VWRNKNWGERSDIVLAASQAGYLIVARFVGAGSGDGDEVLASENYNGYSRGRLSGQEHLA